VISEYALGQYGWVLSLMFMSWALSTWALAIAIRSQLKTTAGKIAWWLLVASGFGAAMASVFEINHPLHDVAGAIGILGPVSAMMVSVILSRNPLWSAAKRPLLWTANLTWIAVVLFIATLIVLMVTYKAAGGDLTTPPKELPPGAIGLVGYANRFVVGVSSCGWRQLRGTRFGWERSWSSRRRPLPDDSAPHGGIFLTKPPKREATDTRASV
jgi:NADH:ubiquinone oxidoreductase subunit 6 (subunit J)